jgi:hypothetical protein
LTTRARLFTLMARKEAVHLAALARAMGQARADLASAEALEMRLHRLMALVRGDWAVADACLDGVVKWGNPEVRSDAQRSDAAMKDKSIGIPMETILADRFDKSQEEISRILAQIEAADARDVAATVAPFLRPQRQPEPAAPAPAA